MRSARGADKAMIDLVYVSWNRRRYTELSFGALLANTDWDLVGRLFLADDASEDGTREWLADAARDVPCHVAFLPAPFRGPVAAINLYLTHYAEPTETSTFGKIDNDTMAPSGWLNELLYLLDRYPDVDLLGMAPDIGPPIPCPYPYRTVRYADWVDGNGLWRHRTFAGKPLPTPGHSNGRFGFTEWQGAHPEVTKAWAAPDLPVFQLDLLPFEPYLSLAEEYVQRGWQRRWPPHHPSATDYWAWAPL